LVTIDVDTPTRTAMSLLDMPSAQASTIFDRCANTCEDFARRDQRSNCSRSDSDNSITAAGLPVRVIRTL
jgi:hypothetical protein